MSYKLVGTLAWHYDAIPQFKPSVELDTKKPFLVPLISITTLCTV